MAENNVLRFPGTRGNSNTFSRILTPFASRGAGTGEVDAGEPTQAVMDNPPQTGVMPPAAPPIAQLQARLATTLGVARAATRKLVDKAVPGTIEEGLFNQFGLIQNSLAQLAARVAEATGPEELAAIGQDLEGLEKSTAEYAAAVDEALASAPAVQAAAPKDNRLLYWIVGGTAAAAALGTGMYFWLKQHPTSPRKKRPRIAALLAGTDDPKPRKKKRRRRTA